MRKVIAAAAALLLALVALPTRASDLSVETYAGPATSSVNTNLIYTATIANRGANCSAVPWKASEVLTLNTYRNPTASNSHCYKVTTAGTTNSSEPTWPTSAGGTVTDGSVVWTEQGGETENTTLLFNFATGQTFVSITKPASFTCTTPSVGVSGSISCTNSTFASTTPWQASELLVLNQIRYPTTPNGHWYKVTTAGTTGSSEPSWNTGSGSTTSDGTVTFTEIGTDTFTVTVKIPTGTALWTWAETWAEISFANANYAQPDYVDENNRIHASTRVIGP